MEMKNATVKTQEEYLPFIWDKKKGKWQMMGQQRANTLDLCKYLVAEYRRNWETHHPEFDFNKIEIRHRTIVTIFGEWDVV
jgi:hypothetical protein